MEKFIFIILSICFLQGLILPIKADCNACGQSNFACVSHNEYQQCVNNKPDGTINKCAEGSYCSIFGSCSENEDIVDCKDCFKCDSTGTFACIGTKKFALCLGTGNYTDVQSQCTGDYVCNIGMSKICTLGSATCSIRDDPTEAPPTVKPSVPTPTTNAPAFCEAMEEEGRYPVGTNSQTTCHQYIHCLLINDVWYGPIYNCPGNNYFDSSKRTCVAEMPSTCGPATSGLSFRNILLE